MKVLKGNIDLLGGLVFTVPSYVNYDHMGQVFTTTDIRDSKYPEPYYNETGSKIVIGKGIRLLW